MKEKYTIEFEGSIFMKDIRRKASKVDQPSAEVSLRDIEAQCDVSASTLSRIDNDNWPDLKTFLRLCEAFMLEPSDYLSWIKWAGDYDTPPMERDRAGLAE